jgi:hypothetical protein
VAETYDNHSPFVPMDKHQSVLAYRLDGSTLYKLITVAVSVSVMWC